MMKTIYIEQVYKYIRKNACYNNIYIYILIMSRPNYLMSL